MGLYDIDIRVGNHEDLSEFRAMLINSGNYGNTQEYKEIYSKFCDIEDRFKDTLTQTQIADYTEIIRLTTDMEMQEGNENFILGFKAALRLFIDCSK